MITILIHVAQLLASLAAASPFGTINSDLLHQHAEHKMITRLALQCPQGSKSDGICFEPASLDRLAGKTGSNGAVGSPDSFEPTQEASPAHCDDADFLDIPGYPQRRENATTALQACRDHLRIRFMQGILSAGRIFDDDDKLIERELDFTEACEFVHRGLTFDESPGFAKRFALEGLGRALHGTQHFYSHSNWADQADPNRPISVLNPPGLDRRILAPFLYLRAENQIANMVPRNLTTGCFNAAEMLPFFDGTGSLGCQDRVIHATINKDHGIITLDGGITLDIVGVPREAVPGNFERAVRSAIADSKEQWTNFRHELQLHYGAAKANIIICVFVRDHPEKDCRNRKIAIVIDSSGSKIDTDPSSLRIQAAKNFNARLTSAAKVGSAIAPDKVSVIDFDTSAKMLYPMGNPDGAAGVFDAINSLGGTNIGSGISAAIDEILKSERAVEFIAHRSGIVILTDGDDASPTNQLIQLARAKPNNIRVSWGHLGPPPNPVPRKQSENSRRMSLPLFSPQAAPLASSHLQRLKRTSSTSLRAVA